MTRGGRPPKLTPNHVDYARMLIARGSRVIDIAVWLGVAPTTLRRYLRDEVKTYQERTA